jgi:ketosteroid isomerase-like protein
MRRIVFVGLVLSALFVAASRARYADASQMDEIIALERGALDRWGKGDPNGFLEVYSQEITYFDPGLAKRKEGHAAMTEYLLPFTGRINIPRYEMIDPKIQRHGDVAVLTYNLRSESVRPDGQQVTVRWNSTAVYARAGRGWKMVHSHWSLTALPGARGVM